MSKIPEEFEALATYGGKITAVDVKLKEFKLQVAVSETDNIELNFFGANLALAIEAIAKSAYEKGKFDQKQSSQSSQSSLRQTLDNFLGRF